jgi:hypothetical protein
MNTRNLAGETVHDETREVAIEPELLGPTPRRVRFRWPGFGRKETAGCGLLTLFLLPFYAIGIYAFVNVAHATSVRYTGAETTGVVTDMRTSQDSDDSYPYSVTYRYRIDGKDYTGTSKVDSQSYNSWYVGSRVPVLYLPATPEWHTRIRGAESGNLSFHWMWVLIWDGLLFGLSAAGCYACYSARALIVRGTPVLGTITDKTKELDDRTYTYQIHYEFSPMDSDGVQVTGRQSIADQKQWNAANVGDRLTVVYLPDRPKKHMLYRYQGFRAVGR